MACSVCTMYAVCITMMSILLYTCGFPIPITEVKISFHNLFIGDFTSIMLVSHHYVSTKRFLHRKKTSTTWSVRNVWYNAWCGLVRCHKWMCPLYRRGENIQNPKDIFFRILPPIQDNITKTLENIRNIPY